MPSHYHIHAHDPQGAPRARAVLAGRQAGMVMGRPAGVDAAIAVAAATVVGAAVCACATATADPPVAAGSAAGAGPAGEGEGGGGYGGGSWGLKGFVTFYMTVAALAFLPRIPLVRLFLGCWIDRSRPSNHRSHGSDCEWSIDRWSLNSFRLPLNTNPTSRSSGKGTPSSSTPGRSACGSGE